VPVAARGRDDFDAPELAPHWVGVRQSPSTVASLVTRPGWLVIHGGASTLDSPEPSFVGRRQQHQCCGARARIDVGSSAEAGLVIVMDETAHYEVVISQGEILARARVGPLHAVVGRAPCPAEPIVLTIATEPHGLGPDAVILGYEDEAGALQTLAQLDGRSLSTEVTGGFLGRTIGMFAVGGDAAFDWFDYREA
jgi:beta-xylosidase